MSETTFADIYLASNKGFFPAEKLPMIREKLISLSPEKQQTVQAMPLKNPNTTLILSLFLGGISVDRFYLGDIFLGILKFITEFIIIGFIWVFLDIYFCYQKAKEINYRNVMEI